MTAIIMPLFLIITARLAYFRTSRWVLLLWLIACLAPVSALATEPVSNASTLDSLREAQRARSERAREEAAWDTERQRLEALIAATTAESTRIQLLVTQAEAMFAAVHDRKLALGSSVDLEAVRTLLRAGGERLAASLVTIAKHQVPGVIPSIDRGESVFDSALRALDAAEQAAGRVVVEVVIGRQGELTEAVKMLRVGGSTAWWLSLDGTRAGTVRMENSVVVLQQGNDPARAAIAAAVAQAEGRQPPSVVLMPGATP